MQLRRRSFSLLLTATQSYDSQFKFRNGPQKGATFGSYRTQRLQHSGARGNLDFSSPVASHTLLVGSVG